MVGVSRSRGLPVRGAVPIFPATTHALAKDSDMSDLTNEAFGGTWPFAPRFFEHDGVRLHYVDEGAGEPIVLLHGNPTWGYLYRKFIPALSATHRCVVPDYMGFGKSDKPLDKPYT